MTKKEIIENGWVEKYVLGLTSEDESAEVERLANLYPEIQDSLNATRNKICGKFNRNLTQPALRETFMNKRKMKILSVAGVALFTLGFCFLCRELFSLKATYSAQSKILEEEHDKVIQLAAFNQMASEQSKFLHASTTQRIRLKGCGASPDAEVMVFKCQKSGKMMLRVVDLPELPEGQYYEVWAEQNPKPGRLLGLLKPPLRFDSLYPMDSMMNAASIQIKSMDLATHKSNPVCLADLSH